MAAEGVTKPQSLPPYPEMILAAISALNEEEGSNKSEISKYIESTYGELPEGHQPLLLHHLNRMKDNGELILVKNNYMRPNPNTPTKRGRGRPPKPKASVVPAAVTSTPRPRGRPPKAKDPSAIAVPVASKSNSSSGSGRGRGRPPKKARPAVATTPTKTKMATGPPRPRGRPPKQGDENYEPGNNHHATGEYAYGGADDVDLYNNDTDDINILLGRSDGQNLDDNEESASMSISSTQNVGVKETVPSAQNQNVDGVREMVPSAQNVNGVGEMIRRMVDKLDELVKVVDPLYVGRKLHEELIKVEGFSKKYLLAAFKLLREDPVKTEIFLVHDAGYKKKLLEGLRGQIGDL